MEDETKTTTQIIFYLKSASNLTFKQPSYVKKRWIFK